MSNFKPGLVKVGGLTKKQLDEITKPVKSPRQFALAKTSEALSSINRYLFDEGKSNEQISCSAHYRNPIM